MDEFASQGLQVLAFPSNEFSMLEPADTGLELMNGIKWVRPGGGYVPKFQMFAKGNVNGDKEQALYTYLKGTCGPTSDAFESSLFYSPLRVSDVRWNFEIFLIHKTSGMPIYRYSPDHPLAAIRSDIIKELNAEQNNEVPAVAPIVSHSLDIRQELTNQLEPQVEQPDYVANEVPDY